MLQAIARKTHAIVVDIYLGSGNHGCTDFITVRFDGPTARVGTVVEAQGCSSCWQVGHDREYAEWAAEKLGRKVRLWGMKAGTFAGHIMELARAGSGKLAEDAPSCTHHWRYED